jgi:hypothetical protein
MTKIQGEAIVRWMDLGWKSLASPHEVSSVSSGHIHVGGPVYMQNDRADMVFIDSDGKAYAVDPASLRRHDPLSPSKTLPDALAARKGRFD